MQGNDGAFCALVEKKLKKIQDKPILPTCYRILDEHDVILETDEFEDGNKTWTVKEGMPELINNNWKPTLKPFKRITAR